MPDGLLVSHILLWCLVIVLALVVLALSRQVGVLHERVSPAGALLGREGPRVGEPAPILMPADWSGRPVAIGGLDPEQRSTLLVFVSPTCSVCKTMLAIVEAVIRDEAPTRLVLASDGPREEHDGFVRANGLAERTYVLSRERFRGRQGLMTGTLVLQMVSPVVLLVPIYGLISAMGLIDTHAGLVLVYTAMQLPLTVAVLKTFFDGVPEEP